MFRKKYINFHFGETKEPFSLCFYSEKGGFLAKKNKTTKPLDFCLPICSSRLYMLAQSRRRAETLSFFLVNQKCLNFCVNLDSPIVYAQQFSLLDKNYSFPIKNAKLFFEKDK